MKKTLIASSIAAALSLAACAASANLVTNGDFEITTLTRSYELSNTNVTGWTSVSTSGYNSNRYSVLYFPGQATTVGAGGTGDGASYKLWAASTSPAGGNFIAIDADPVANSILEQTIHGLTVGGIYDLTFYFAGAQATTRTGATTDWWQVSLGNQTQNTAKLSDPSQGFTGWFQSSMQFTATSTDEVLAFLALGTPSGYPPMSLLDGVSLTQHVPEPSSGALCIAGLVAAGVAMKKRRAAA